MTRLKPHGQQLAEFQAHGIGLAISHAQYPNAVLKGYFNHGRLYLPEEQEYRTAVQQHLSLLGRARSSAISTFGGNGDIPHTSADFRG